MGLIGGCQDDPALAELESDETEVAIYLNGTERNYRIRDLVRKARC
jgi:hypothetical protein